MFPSGCNRDAGKADTRGTSRPCPISSRSPAPWAIPWALAGLVSFRLPHLPASPPSGPGLPASRHNLKWGTPTLPLEQDVRQGDIKCPHYVQEIFKYLRQCEVGLYWTLDDLPALGTPLTASLPPLPQHAKRPDRAYLESNQRDLNSAMRGILVDWMVEVAEEYKLQPETLFLAVQYVDRYLSQPRSRDLARSKLQLVGVTAMLLAAKYEEIYAPHVDDFVYITGERVERGSAVAPPPFARSAPTPVPLPCRQHVPA